MFSYLRIDSTTFILAFYIIEYKALFPKIVYNIQQNSHITHRFWLIMHIYIQPNLYKTQWFWLVINLINKNFSIFAAV